MRPSPFALSLNPSRKQSECAAHGRFESLEMRPGIWTKCPTCGAAEEAEYRREEAEREQREREMRWGRQLDAAGIPERFRTATLESYRADGPGQEKALAFARSYAEQFASAMISGRSCMFVGRPGTGKTHLAVGIAQALMREGRSTCFTTVQRLVRRVKATWSRPAPETETDAIRSATRPDLLVLDEVGVQTGSDYETNLLFDVLNERYEARRATILVSNLPHAQIQEVLGERIVDRLREDGGRVIVFDWSSHRRQGGQ
jgi:DNA replication protein DnaC